MQTNRRNFIRNSALAAAGLTLAPSLLKAGMNKENELFFQISLAEWSLHKTLFKGDLTNMEFPLKAKNDFGINAVEYVSTFFPGIESKTYLGDLLKLTTDNGIKNVLIMVDGEGNLGDSYEPKRIQAVERHYRWIETAKFLGCHSIRVNARGNGSAKEVKKAAIDGLARLSEYGEKLDIGVIVENHGGYSSDAQWLTSVMKGVGNDYCGTLPDFGNFCVKNEQVDGKRTCVEEYDKYLGTEELMEYAKGVSAKSLDFAEDGTQPDIDYTKLIKIVKDAGYKGYIGIEYSGSNLSEDEGIMATKKLLQKVGGELL